MKMHTTNLARSLGHGRPRRWSFLSEVSVAQVAIVMMLVGVLIGGMIKVQGLVDMGSRQAIAADTVTTNG